MGFLNWVLSNAVRMLSEVREEAFIDSMATGFTARTGDGEKFGAVNVHKYGEVESSVSSWPGSESVEV